MAKGRLSDHLHPSILVHYNCHILDNYYDVPFFAFLCLIPCTFYLLYFIK